MQDGQSEPRMILESHTELEGLQYLEDTDKTLSSLRRYPRVSEVFKKYRPNVALPLSAAVERLFSVQSGWNDKHSQKESSSSVVVRESFTATC